jgi:protein involved in sex pheromone biosynthesis
MARSARDVAVHESFKKIAAKYLDIEMAYVGYLVYDETVKKSVRQMVPITTFGDSEVVGCLNAVTRNIIALEENGHGRA